MGAELIEFPTGKRLNKPQTPEMSRRELSDAARSYYWNRLEEHERMAEIYRRALGMIANERGVPPVLEPGEGQLTLGEEGND